MNPEIMMASILIGALQELSNDPYWELAHAIKNGVFSHEQLDEFTRVCHGGMDHENGCMVNVVTDLAELQVPHHVINHVIRTYVRLNDKREQEGAGQWPPHSSVRLPPPTSRKRSTSSSNFSAPKKSLPWPRETCAAEWPSSRRSTAKSVTSTFTTFPSTRGTRCSFPFRSTGTGSTGDSKTNRPYISPEETEMADKLATYWITDSGPSPWDYLYGNGPDPFFGGNVKANSTTVHIRCKVCQGPMPCPNHANWGIVGYPKYQEKPQPPEKTHTLFVVVAGSPKALFEMQQELFSHTGPDVEIKKFEIKPIVNS